MDIRKIKKLIELLEESGIAELEIKEGEESVRISRQMTNYAQPMPAMMPNMAPQPQTMAAPAAAPAEVPEAELGHLVEPTKVPSLYQPAGEVQIGIPNQRDIAHRIKTGSGEQRDIVRFRSIANNIGIGRSLQPPEEIERNGVVIAENPYNALLFDTPIVRGQR